MLYFWDRWGVLIIAIVLSVALFAGLVYGAFWLSEIECSVKTADMGFAHRWFPLGGCQIEVNPGQWIPLESYYFKQE